VKEKLRKGVQRPIRRESYDKRREVKSGGGGSAEKREVTRNSTEESSSALTLKGDKRDSRRATK